MTVSQHLQQMERPAATDMVPGDSGGTRRSRVRTGLAVATVAVLAALLWMALAWAPEDPTQGPSQRIFYVHVPSAWIGFLAFGVVFGASIAHLIRGSERSDRLAAASAEIGVLFTTGVLLTGPLWAKPIWGVYWAWDPRLTSYLVLWLIYLTYLALRRYVPDPVRRARFSAVVGIVGFIDVPIVYLSVSWWRAQHPELMILRQGGPRMPGEDVLTLMVGLAAFTLMYTYLLLTRMRVERLEEQAEALAEEVA